MNSSLSLVHTCVGRLASLANLSCHTWHLRFQLVFKLFKCSTPTISRKTGGRLVSLFEGKVCLEAVIKIHNHSCNSTVMQVETLTLTFSLSLLPCRSYSSTITKQLQRLAWLFCNEALWFKMSCKSGWPKGPWALWPHDERRAWGIREIPLIHGGMGTPVPDWQYQCRMVLFCGGKWAWGNAVHPQEAGAISIDVDFSFFFNIIVVNYDVFFFDLKSCPILLLRHGRTHTHTTHWYPTPWLAFSMQVLVLASVSSLVMLLNTFAHHPHPAGHQHPWPLCLFEKNVEH